jgi:hypothetical protein
VGLPTRKQMKQDVIFSSATQRARFFKHKLHYEYLVTTTPVDEVLERVNQGQDDIVLVGDDETDVTHHIIAHLLAQATRPVAIYRGADVGNKVRRIMMPYRGTSHDRIALEFTRAMANATSHPEIVILLLPGAPNHNEIDFLTEENYFGQNATVTVRDERNENELLTMDVIQNAVEDLGDIELLIMGRIDEGDSEHSIAQFIHRVFFFFFSLL